MDPQSRRNSAIPVNAADPVEAIQAGAAEKIAPNPTRRWRARVFQLYLVVATAAFGILVVLASQFNYFPIDLSITRAVQSLHAAWFASLMEWISFPGYAPQMYILIAVVILLLFAIGLRWEAAAALVSCAGGAGLAQVIKLFVHRPRPGANLVTVLQQIGNYSFPSGHVLTYIAFFGFLFFLAFSLLKPSAIRTILFIFLGSLVASIGISRIYVGDHWASDVIGAYLLGSLWLVAMVYLYRWGKPRFFVSQPLAKEQPGPGETKCG